MAIIGSFKKQGEDFTGTITTLTLTGKVTFRPAQSDSEKGPQFRLFVGKAEVGAAWSKSTREGKSYLSCKIDDPRPSTHYRVARF